LRYGKITPNQPPLPLHDCIIVPESQAMRAIKLMDYTVRYMFGREASIPVVMKNGMSEERQAA